MSKVGGFKPLHKNFHQRELPPDQDAKLREVAKKYEKYFLKEMYKAMKKTVNQNGYLKPSMGEKIYQDHLDQEYIEVWGNKGGIGLNQVIYKELKEKILPRIYGAPQRVHPSQIKPMNAKPEIFPLSEPQPEKVEKKPQDLGFKIELPATKNDKVTKVLTPLDGVVTSLKKVSGNVIAQLDHGNGTRSELSFQGDPRVVQPGNLLKKGDVIGHAQGPNRTLIWNIEQSPS